MIERFFKLYEAYHNKKRSLQLTIEHDDCCGWYIVITHTDSNTVVFEEEGCSFNLLCAKGYIVLTEWASKFSELEDIEINLK
jgi:hypothetical protein